MFFTWLPMFLYLSLNKDVLPEPPEEELPVEPYEYFQPPPELTTEDESLTAPATHETAGLLRAFRAGMSPARICRLMGYSKQQLMHWMNLGLDDEREAHRQSISIYDDRIISCEHCGDALWNDVGTKKFRCRVCLTLVYADPSLPEW